MNKPIVHIKNIMKNTHTDRIVLGYLLFVFVSALLIMITEPKIDNYGDALWYCYAVISTAGFGDVVVTGVLPKIISVLFTIYSLFIIAIVTGVVVNYYNQLISVRNKETLNAFMDRLEHLPELSDEELAELSERVALFRETGEMKKK